MMVSEDYKKRQPAGALLSRSLSGFFT